MSKDTEAEIDIHEVAPPPVEADYVNPADKSPRWLLGAHAFFLRLGANIGFGLGNRTGQDVPPTPTRTIYIDSTLGKGKPEAQISASVWIPQSNGAPNNAKNRLAVINFHGGGFILGQATDDARWAAALMKGLDAVVFSVNYRLAPGYPFPTGVEDCVDSIIQIAKRAEEFGINPDRIILSGFSAGGNLALSSWIVLQNPAQFGYTEMPSPLPRVAGFALYYPLLDWTLDRPQKRAACSRPDMTLPSGLTDLIDASYIHPSLPRRERTDIRLSPGLMPDDFIDQLPPVHLCLCEYDMLLAEGKLFAERMEDRGKKISVRVVEAEKHAWDKPLPLGPKGTVSFEYEITIDAIKSWFDEYGAADPGMDDIEELSSN
ncbi:Alpha/Beta hydrolase protein [Xylariaceae sp. FL0255]|nr:Alpha/Beta hydrolase protein [Xylariaceae sp. FL0255]